MAECTARFRRPLDDDFCSTGVTLYQGKYDNTDGYADFSRRTGKWPVILQMLRIDVPENGGHGPLPEMWGQGSFSP